MLSQKRSMRDAPTARGTGVGREKRDGAKRRQTDRQADRQIELDRYRQEKKNGFDFD